VFEVLRRPQVKRSVVEPSETFRQGVRAIAG
jgi:hypothetical protein